MFAFEGTRDSRISGSRRPRRSCLCNSKELESAAGDLPCFLDGRKNNGNVLDVPQIEPRLPGPISITLQGRASVRWAKEPQVEKRSQVGVLTPSECDVLTDVRLADLAFDPSRLGWRR